MTDQRLERGCVRARAEAATPAVVVAAQLGDRAALEQVLGALQAPLFEHIRFVLRDADAARDVLQSVLLSIARSLHRLRDPRLISAWAFRIAHRAAVRQSRKRRDEAASLPLGEAPDLANEVPLPSLFEPELIAALHLAVPTLPHACGAAVRLRYLEQLSLVEVAEALEIPVGTVKSRLHYGLALLKERLPTP